MKEFIDKILSAKYTGYIALVAAIVIVIVAVYLMSLQYNDGKNTSLNVSEYNENNKTNTTVKENMEINVEKNGTTEKNLTVEEKVDFVDSLEIYFKGKSIGTTTKYSSTAEPKINDIKSSVSRNSVLKTTLDQVLSIDLSKLNNTTLKTIKSIKAIIYNKDGKELFNSNVANLYNKVSIAIDELEKSDEYYALIEFDTSSDYKTVRYIFQF